MYNIIIGIILVIVFIDVISKVREAHKDKQWRINNLEETFSQEKQNFDNGIKRFCSSDRGGFSSYAPTKFGMEKGLKTMTSLNGELVKLRASEDRSAVINQCRNDFDRLMSFESHIKEVSEHGMMDSAHYGQIDQGFMDAVHAMTAKEVEDLLRQCENAQKEGTLDAITSIDAEKLMQSLWFFAMEKPYRAKAFEHAKDICKWYFDVSYPIDAEMARWYAQRQMGGTEMIKTDTAKIYGESAERTASCLMWLQAYKQEQKLLQEMLSGNMPMSPKAQERLHALNNGGGNAPDTHQAVSTGDQLFFDVSALAWKEAEYNSLFENLAFQDKKLTYALAVRDEDKDLLLPAGVSLPDKEALLAKFQADFNDEYGDQASARGVELVILSGSGEEHMEGILATSTECRQLGIAAHMARIGKKVNIKFYTLFLPDGLELAAQKQQALSLSRKLNPTVSMWENGLKTSMLTSIQQLLNSSVQSGGQPEAPLPQNDTKPEEPVF